MRNVIVFSLAGRRCAIELRWVREVINIGYVTLVPQGPAPVAGVVNVGGAIVPVVDPRKEPPGGRARAQQGDTAVLVEVEGTRAALRIGPVEEVVTLVEKDGVLVSANGDPVELIDPKAVLARAKAKSQAPAGERGRPRGEV